jgi:hypothetical protein
VSAVTCGQPLSVSQIPADQVVRLAGLTDEQLAVGPRFRPRGLDNTIPGNSATLFYGLLNAPAQITVAKEMARVKGGHVPDISRLRAGNFYAALEGSAFHKITAPWCLSHHPHSPLATEVVLELSRRPLGPKS